MDNNWHNVYITDKSGRKMWNNTASPMATMSEVRNLTRKIEQARKHPAAFPGLDVATAVVMVDGQSPIEMSDDELLAELLGEDCVVCGEHHEPGAMPRACETGDGE